MGNPFEDALSSEIRLEKPKAKKAVEKDIIKILENADAVDPGAVYTQEQLKDAANDGDNAIKDIRKRLEGILYELDTITDEISAEHESQKSIYNDMTYGQQHDLIGPGDRIHDQAGMLAEASKLLEGISGRISEAISALDD
ncbi:MAG: hypothetical protein K6C99_08275 [Lachnospiraceae bacterium]|nr:hypothetical protein [Lachnospiraceae bacterium]